ncbi:MAG: hypothetical protein DCC57_25400, partial [Chloroflexi bacterium]
GPAADPAAALCAAQVWLRELTAAEVMQLPIGIPDTLSAGGLPGRHPFADPRYWAGFVLYGG